MTDRDNTNTGAIYPARDDTWSGFIMLDSTTKAHAEITDSKLIIRPFLKDGKTPGKRPLATSRIVRRTKPTGPAGIVPDLDTPLCIWRATNKTYGSMYLQIRPDRSAPVSTNDLPF